MLLSDSDFKSVNIKRVNLKIGIVSVWLKLQNGAHL